MATADFQITLIGGEPAGGGLTRFQPGQEIRGTVQVIPERDLRCNHLYVRVQWHTEGRGDRDEGRAAQVDVFQGTLSTNVPTTYPFRLALPREPWSYAGYYINIIWEVVAEIDVPLALDVRGTQPFILAPELRAGGWPRPAVAPG